MVSPTKHTHSSSPTTHCATATDSGALPGSSYAYTPFGVVAGGNMPSPFGFTGELQSEGLVYLRARWYDPSSGVFTARDPFAGINTIPNTLHPYMYAADNPLLYTDPSGKCYGALEGLRNYEREWCRNLDKAVLIYTDPHTSASDKAWAYTYAGAWYVGHAVMVAGVVISGKAAIDWVFVQGAAYLATHPAAQSAVVAGSTVIGGVDDLIVATSALLGDPYAANEIVTAQQLAASDGALPFSDLLAACSLIIPKIGGQGAKFISLGQKYRDYQRWWQDGRVGNEMYDGTSVGDAQFFPGYFRDAAQKAETIYFDIDKVNIEMAFKQGDRILADDQSKAMGMGFTAWEFYTVLNNKTFLDKAVWHRNGQALSPEEIEKLYREAENHGWTRP